MDRRSENPTGESVRLLTYQVNELREGISKYQADVKSGLTRIERKIDDNMEAVMVSHSELDRRVVELERDREAQRRAVQALEKRDEKGLNTWHIIGIAGSLLFAFMTIAVAVIAIIVTILVNVL